MNDRVRWVLVAKAVMAFISMFANAGTAHATPEPWRSVRIRVSETGTGVKMFESPGILEPGQRARFAARGVRNVDDGWNLLRDIFLFATLECVAAARYPAP